MNCNNCGTELHPEALFCHKCGARFIEKPEEKSIPLETKKDIPVQPEVDIQKMTDQEKVDALLSYQSLVARRDSLKETDPEDYHELLRSTWSKVCDDPSNQLLEKPELKDEYDLSFDLYLLDLLDMIKREFIPVRFLRIERNLYHGLYELVMMREGEKEAARHYPRGKKEYDVVRIKGGIPLVISGVLFPLSLIAFIQNLTNQRYFSWGLTIFMVVSGILFAFLLAYRIRAFKAGYLIALEENQKVREYNEVEYPKKVQAYEDEVAKMAGVLEHELSDVENEIKEAQPSFDAISKSFPIRYNNYNDLQMLQGIFEDMRASSLQEAINILVADKIAQEELEIKRAQAEAESEAQSRMARAAEMQAQAAREQAYYAEKAARDAAWESQYEQREREKKYNDAQRMYESELAGLTQSRLSGDTANAARHQEYADRAFAEMMKNK